MKFNIKQWWANRKNKKSEPSKNTSNSSTKPSSTRVVNSRVHVEVNETGEVTPLDNMNQAISSFSRLAEIKLNSTTSPVIHTEEIPKPVVIPSILEPLLEEPNVNGSPRDGETSKPFAVSTTFPIIETPTPSTQIEEETPKHSGGLDYFNSTYNEHQSSSFEVSQPSAQESNSSYTSTTDFGSSSTDTSSTTNTSDW